MYGSQHQIAQNDKIAKYMPQNIASGSPQISEVIR